MAEMFYLSSRLGSVHHIIMTLFADPCYVCEQGHLESYQA